MWWPFQKTQKKKPHLDSSTSIPPTSEPPLPPTSEPPLPPISLLDEQKTKITFSASLVSANSIPFTNGVSNSNGKEVQVAQNTSLGSIYTTGEGSQIPETRQQKSSEQQGGSNAAIQIAQKKTTEFVRMTSRIQIGNHSVRPSDNTNSENTDSVIDLFTGNAVSQKQLDQINKERQEEARREADAKAKALAAEAADRARREGELTEATKALEEERVRKEVAEAEAEEKAKALAAEAAEEKAKALAEVAEAAEAKALAEAAKAKQEEEERARLAKVTQVNVTPMDKTDEQEQETLLNKLCNDILNNLDAEKIDEDLKAKIINELLEDFSSNQNYTTNDTTNTTNAISSNNTKDSTSENQISIPPTRNPPASEKYTAKLAPKTYYGVGIQTELVREDNKSPYLNITQFYDDSGFKSALEAQHPSIETKGKDIKITAIECDLLDGNGKKDYSIDEIFIKCGKNEMNFNLKLCAIFRNLTENELKLKFSIEGGLQDQYLNIKKSVFTKDENNEEYKNIKTVIKQQTVIRQQNQAQPSEAISDPKNGGRPFDNKSFNPISISVVG